MVGFDPDVDKTKGKAQVALSGIASGTITRFLLQPLDVVKIRFQVQLEPISYGGGKYTGIYCAFKQILKEEGLPALWKGHIAAQLLSTTYSLFQFLTFETLTEKAWKTFPRKSVEEHQLLLNFVCGGIGGSMGMLTAMPFDVIRTRFICQGEPKIYRNLVHASQYMMAHEGPRAFFKGISPALIQIYPFAGLQFMFYNSLCPVMLSWLEENNHVDQSGIIHSMTCGMFSGLLAKTAVYPLDLVKKRLQIQGFERSRFGFGKVEQYKGIMDCLVKTVKGESFWSLYKGFQPSCLKATIATGFNFCVYEQALRLIRYFSDEPPEISTSDASNSKPVQTRSSSSEN